MLNPPHVILIVFVFLLGACIGSFLNVVVWRLPAGMSLSKPGSHCPKCRTPLKWYDNLPVVGWIKLGGKCRFCKEPISIRYPIVEAATGLMFVVYYVMFFQAGVGPGAPAAGGRAPQWVYPNDAPLYAMYMYLAASLLAASLIDAELFIIPLEIVYYGLLPLAFLFHAWWDNRSAPGSLLLESPASAALSAGAALGLLVTVVLYRLGRMPQAFPAGEPITDPGERAAIGREIEQAKAKGEDYLPLPPEYTPRQIRREMRKEMLFLMPALLGGLTAALLAAKVPAVRAFFAAVVSRPGYDWLNGLLGSVLGAMVGAFVVWLTRILGTLGFGRVAMGLGDVHLMFAVGAVLGGGAATVAFFLAPFFGLALAVYMIFAGKRRELPYGPYLSLSTGFVMLYYGRIADWLRPGVEGLILMLREMM